ncbi:hypothetical protein [Planctomicrobium sp. SH664]|uniref:hypothetical protein n=1 Tax=Planctomicrobium sp. SH664 TaxID=3448125 RepID=UPI003F5BB37B
MSLPPPSRMLPTMVTTAGAPVGICDHFPFSRTELTALVQTKRLQSVQGLLARYGRGAGCEICRPLLDSILLSSRDDSAENWKHAKRNNQVLQPRPSPLTEPDSFFARKRLNAAAPVSPISDLAVQLQQRYEELKFPADVVISIQPGSDGQPPLQRSHFSIDCHPQIDSQSTTSAIRPSARRRRPFSPAGEFPAEIDSTYTLSLPESPRPIGQRVTLTRLFRTLDACLAYYLSTARAGDTLADWLECLEGGSGHVQQVVVEDKLGIRDELEDLLADLRNLPRLSAVTQLRPRNAMGFYRRLQESFQGSLRVEVPDISTLP